MTLEEYKKEKNKIQNETLSLMQATLEIHTDGSLPISVKTIYIDQAHKELDIIRARQIKLIKEFKNQFNIN